MKVDEICIGDVFLVDIGYIQALKGNGAKRPVRVVRKYKHYILCETEEMINGFGLPTIPYRMCFMAMDLVNKVSDKELNKWKKQSTVELFFPD